MKLQVDVASPFERSRYSITGDILTTVTPGRDSDQSCQRFSGLVVTVTVEMTKSARDFRETFATLKYWDSDRKPRLVKESHFASNNDSASQSSTRELKFTDNFFGHGFIQL